MRAVHAKYPEDNDAAMLLAAALMELSPWNYWTRDGLPLENTVEMQQVLEEVIEELRAYMLDQLQIVNPAEFARDKKYLLLVVERA